MQIWCNFVNCAFICIKLDGCNNKTSHLRFADHFDVIEDRIDEANELGFERSSSKIDKDIYFTPAGYDFSNNRLKKYYFVALVTKESISENDFTSPPMNFADHKRSKF